MLINIEVTWKDLARNREYLRVRERIHAGSPPAISCFAAELLKPVYVRKSRATGRSRATELFKHSKTLISPWKNETCPDATSTRPVASNFHAYVPADLLLDFRTKVESRIRYTERKSNQDFGIPNDSDTGPRSHVKIWSRRENRSKWTLERSKLHRTRFNSRTINGECILDFYRAWYESRSGKIRINIIGLLFQ